MRQLRRIAASFPFAFAGLAYMVRTQTNFWVHLTTAVIVLALALSLGVGGLELAVLMLVIGLVLVAEAINTALEATVDLASPELHPLARVAKDVGAAAVLLAAGTSVAIGGIILLPRLLRAVGLST